MLHRLALVSCSLVAALSVSSARAQQVAYKSNGLANTHIGTAVSSAGDVDADGVEDFVGLVANLAGSRVYSGRTGAVLFTLAAYRSVGAAGDVDGDGHDDVIFGTTDLLSVGNGYVYVMSGASGAQLLSFVGAQYENLGVSVTGIGDFDADGHDDVLVGAPHANPGNAGAAYVFSGSDGSTLATFGGGAGDQLGNSVARAGDVDHDGTRDFLIGAVMGGYVQIRSGATGAMIRSVPVGAQCWAVGDAGDADADGTADVAGGISTSTQVPEQLVIASGATGAMLQAIDSPVAFGSKFGRTLAPMGDWDGDGHDDLAVGAGQDGTQGDSAGAVRLFSGADGHELAAWYGSEDGKMFGWSIAALNLDNDGRGDLVVGAPGDGTLMQPTGRLYVYLSATPVPVAYCTAKVNSLGCTPEIHGSGAASVTIGDNFTLRAVDVLNQKKGILFYGLAAGSTPFHGGTLCVGAPVWRTPLQDSGGSPAGTNDCSGAYSFHFSQALMAANGLSAGQSVFAQYWSRDPGFAPPDAIGLTGALEFGIGP